jgi:hypothetical protein
MQSADSLVMTLFAQARAVALAGDDEGRWNCVVELQGVGSEAVFRHAVEWCVSPVAIERAIGADVLAQLRENGKSSSFRERAAPHVSALCVIPMPRSWPPPRLRSAIWECAISSRRWSRWQRTRWRMCVTASSSRFQETIHHLQLQRSFGCPRMRTRRFEIGRRLALALRLTSTPWSFATRSPRASKIRTPTPGPKQS